MESPLPAGAVAAATAAVQQSSTAPQRTPVEAMAPAALGTGAQVLSSAPRAAIHPLLLRPLLLCPSAAVSGVKPGHGGKIPTPPTAAPAVIAGSPTDRCAVVVGRLDGLVPQNIQGLLGQLPAGAMEGVQVEAAERTLYLSRCATEVGEGGVHIVLRAECNELARRLAATGLSVPSCVDERPAPRNDVLEAAPRAA